MRAKRRCISQGIIFDWKKAVLHSNKNIFPGVESVSAFFTSPFIISRILSAAKKETGYFVAWCKRVARKDLQTQK